MVYSIRIEVTRKSIVEHSDDTDRIWYLVQEWIKQPRTRSITVRNENGKQVFCWSQQWTPTSFAVRS